MGPNILKTAGEKDSVTMEHLKEIALGVSISHMPGDVTETPTAGASGHWWSSGGCGLQAPFYFNYYYLFTV